MNNLCRLMVTGLLALNLSGCVGIYLDATTKEVPVTAFKKPANPKPVQLVFEFQTKGVANPKVTEFLAEQVSTQVKGSGLFSEVKNTPAPDGALLSLVINNVVLTDDAYGKAFMSGLTLGLAGTQVTDGYICTIKYLPTAQAPVISKTARHAIHSVLGAKEGPANAIKIDDFEVAAKTMTRQIVSNALNELSQDTEFK